MNRAGRTLKALSRVRVHVGDGPYAFALYLIFRHATDTKPALGFVVKWRRRGNGLSFSERNGGHPRSITIGRFYARTYATRASLSRAPKEG